MIAHSGQQLLSKHAQDVIDDLVTEMNDVSDVVVFSHLDQAQLHGLVRSGISGKAPDLTVTMHDWGMTAEPYQAFYGQVDAAEVAEWWADHRATIFDRNLRKSPVPRHARRGVTAPLRATVVTLRFDGVRRGYA